MTKGKFLAEFAERTGMSKKEATAAWTTVCQIASEQVKGTGQMILPGLVKFAVKEIPAREAYEGIHPFTKEQHKFPAKEATKKLKTTVPKAFKDAALG